MPTEYLKRLRMTRELRAPIELPLLPIEYFWEAWHDSHLDTHAAILREAFSQQIDTLLFPNLRSETGCRMLVRAIRDSYNFCPQASWLIVGPSGPVGCIQGLFGHRIGSIQNVAILPDHRGKGFGTDAILKALQAFSTLQAETVVLDVTERNDSALSIYRRLGFTTYKTDYRAVEIPDRSMVGLGI